MLCLCATMCQNGCCGSFQRIPDYAHIVVIHNEAHAQTTEGQAGTALSAHRYVGLLPMFCHSRTRGSKQGLGHSGCFERLSKHRALQASTTSRRRFAGLEGVTSYRCVAEGVPSIRLVFIRTHLCVMHGPQASVMGLACRVMVHNNR